MNKVNIDVKDFLGLLVGTVEERMNCLENGEVLSKLDINDIKYIYQKEFDFCKKEEEYLSLILMLQTLAYNRHNSKYSDEIATFIFDKLFEIMSNEIPVLD